jgi:hypothetical protein
LGQDGGGEGELGELVAQAADFLALRGDGLAEPGDGLAKLPLLVGDLLCLGADAFLELVLEVGVAFHQGHAVNAGLGGERGDGEGPVGGGGLPCEEAVGGTADAGSLVLVLLVHARASAGRAVASWAPTVARSRAASARSRLAMGAGA